MKTIIHYTSVTILFLCLLAGCTQQERAKTFGGTAKVAISPGQKLVTATWKDAEIWYLTRPMHPGEQAETYTFKESSTLGIMEGTVIITETK